MALTCYGKDISFIPNDFSAEVLPYFLYLLVKLLERVSVWLKLIHQVMSINCMWVRERWGSGWGRGESRGREMQEGHVVYRDVSQERAVDRADSERLY